MTFQSDISTTRQPISTLLWRHRLLMSIMLIHLAVGLGVSVALGVPFESGTFKMLKTQLTILIPVFLIMALFWRFGWMAICVRPEKPIAFFLNDLKVNLIQSDRVASGVIVFLTIALFVGTFSFLKDMIPNIVPFSWDTAFADWDAALHGGTDPWLLLMPLFGTPFATSALNAAYHFWFFLMYWMVLSACFDVKNLQRASVFLVAWVLCWIIGGNIAATALSSVGPVFYEIAGFGDRFVPQMEHLYASDKISTVWALDIQELLAAGHWADGPIKGISAMPSMHVGTTVVMTLYAFTLKRWFGWVMVAFTGIIMIGSVHLAWHYAIDGYLAVVISLFCWWLAKKLVARFSPLAA